jgi:hypothetical protein
MAVAFLALFLVLSGSAVALKGHNKVFSDDITNGQVKSADIRNNGVRGKDVRNNTLTGSDVAESKLRKVPAARTADTATNATNAADATNAAHANTADIADHAEDSILVSGQAIDTFELTVAPDDPSEGFVAGGVELTANCASGNSNIHARNDSGQAAAFQSEWINNAGAHAVPDENFMSGDADNIGDTGSGAGTATVTFADGTVTTMISAYQDAGQTGDNCHYWGRIISG